MVEYKKRLINLKGGGTRSYYSKQYASGKEVRVKKDEYMAKVGGDYLNNLKRNLGSFRSELKSNIKKIEEDKYKTFISSYNQNSAKRYTVTYFSFNPNNDSPDRIIKVYEEQLTLDNPDNTTIKPNRFFDYIEIKERHKAPITIDTDFWKKFADQLKKKLSKEERKRILRQRVEESDEDNNDSGKEVRNNRVKIGGRKLNSFEIDINNENNLFKKSIQTAIQSSKSLPENVKNKKYKNYISTYVPSGSLFSKCKIDGELYDVTFYKVNDLNNIGEDPYNSISQNINKEIIKTEKYCITDLYSTIIYENPYFDYVEFSKFPEGIYAFGMTKKFATEVNTILKK